MIHDLKLNEQKYYDIISHDSLEASIYHYTSVVGLKSILENNELWASESQYLNDSAEIYYIYDVLLDVLNKRSTTTEDDEPMYEDTDDYVPEEENPGDIFRTYITFDSEKILHYGEDSSINRFILSFSLNHDDLSMWNYYTKDIDNAGYNIEFNYEKLLNSIKANWSGKNIAIRSGKVIYNHDRQKEILESLVSDYSLLYAEHPEQEKIILQSFNMILRYLSVFFKAPAFANEAEYRIVISHFDSIRELGDGEEFNIFHRTSKSLFIPYIKVAFSQNSVFSVNISPVISDTLHYNGIKSFLKENNYNNVEIHKSKISLRKI